jgi:hypothetical protein
MPHNEPEPQRQSVLANLVPLVRNDKRFIDSNFFPFLVALKVQSAVTSLAENGSFVSK